MVSAASIRRKAEKVEAKAVKAAEKAAAKEAKKAKTHNNISSFKESLSAAKAVVSQVNPLSFSLKTVRADATTSRNEVKPVFTPTRKNKSTPDVIIGNIPYIPTKDYSDTNLVDYAASVGLPQSKTGADTVAEIIEENKNKSSLGTWLDNRRIDVQDYRLEKQENRLESKNERVEIRTENNPFDLTKVTTIAVLAVGAIVLINSLKK